jgi:hypothetical protein
MKNRKKAIEMATAFRYSPYQMAAAGLRNVSFDEMVSVFASLLNIGTSEDLGNLYKHHPATIEMNREWQEHSCQHYIKGLCKCFMPDNEECWYVKSRKDNAGRHSPEYDEWRTAVFERDDYTCKDCGQRGGELNAHHIKEYAKHPKQRLDVSNGITLCLDCHKARHGGMAVNE